MIQGAPIFRLRGCLLPLVDLGRQLGFGGIDLVESGEAINIVVLQTDGRRFGMVVEGINDTEEIVVKPLGKQLKGIPVRLFADATIMGDGRVCRILDVAGIAHRAGIVSQTEERLSKQEVAKGQEHKDERSAVSSAAAGYGRPDRDPSVSCGQASRRSPARQSSTRPTARLSSTATRSSRSYDSGRPWIEVVVARPTNATRCRWSSTRSKAAQ